MKPGLAHLLAAAVWGIAVTACAAVGTTPTPSGTVAAELDGRTFLSTGVSGRVLVAGSTVRLAFAGGRIAASAGCNSMSGAYTLDGSVMRAAQLATTEMACDPALMAQDRWLAELLAGAVVALGGDTLTLARSGVTLTLVDREVADPDRLLTGTRWVVDGLVDGDAVSSIPSDVRASLLFSDGRVSVEAGCNRGGGTVTITATTLAFGPIALTKMRCEGAAQAVDQAVTAVLVSRAVGYAIDADTLTLDAGGQGLLLRAGP